MAQNDRISTFPLLSMLHEGSIDPGRGRFYQGNCFVLTDTRSNEIEESRQLFRIPTRMDGFILMLCAEGEFTLQCNLREVRVTPGMVFFAQSGTIIQVTHINGGRASLVMGDKVFLGLLDISLQSLLPHIAALNELYCFPVRTQQFELLYQQISILSTFIGQPEKQPHYHDCVRSTARSMFYHFASLLIQHLDADELSGKGFIPTHEESLFRRFLQLVSRHYRSERRISYYAKLMHLTPKYMSTVIRRVSGHGPSEWITQNVLLEAKNMLRYSDMSIQEVAYSLSFPNQSFFGRWFKTHTGLSPKAYRNNK